ncbi:hypothetical protein J6590_046442 [Homalodisca vitripennis]|nr:hypothetical protein J6590_046442 [Homalodisca vitripennis]
MKRKRTPASPRSQVDEVVGILHNAVRRDVCDVYGEHVAMKLKSYSKRTQAFVQHHVNNILFEADMGRYDELPHQNRRFISSVSPNYSASPSPVTTFSSANSGPPSPAILLHPQQTTPEYSGDSTSPLSSLPTYHHLEPQPPTTDHSHQSSSDDADPLASVFASDPGTGVPSEAGTFFSSASTMARQTSGTSKEIVGLETLKRYMRLPYESPLAKNRRVIANRTDAGTHSRKLVSVLAIFPSILPNMMAKSSNDIRLKFSKSPPWSSFKSLSKIVWFLFFKNEDSHTRRLFLPRVSSCNRMRTAAAETASFDSPGAIINIHCKRSRETDRHKCSSSVNRGLVCVRAR